MNGRSADGELFILRHVSRARVAAGARELGGRSRPHPLVSIADAGGREIRLAAYKMDQA